MRNKCPGEITEENELNYSDVEIHIADGVDMGNGVNVVKGKLEIISGSIL